MIIPHTFLLVVGFLFGQSLHCPSIDINPPGPYLTELELWDRPFISIQCGCTIPLYYDTVTYWLVEQMLIVLIMTTSSSVFDSCDKQKRVISAFLQLEIKTECLYWECNHTSWSPKKVLNTIHAIAWVIQLFFWCWHFELLCKNNDILLTLKTTA